VGRDLEKSQISDCPFTIGRLSVNRIHLQNTSEAINYTLWLHYCWPSVGDCRPATTNTNTLFV
jgi:hypothetical protein